MSTLDVIIVGMIVAAAFYFTIRKLYRDVRGSAAGGCDCGCSGCGQSSCSDGKGLQ